MVVDAQFGRGRVAVHAGVGWMCLGPGLGLAVARAHRSVGHFLGVGAIQLYLSTTSESRIR